MSQMNKKLYYAYAWKVNEAEKQKQISEQNGIYIYKSALDRLWGDGFNLDDKGSKYIAKLIEALYHEKELLRRFYKRESFREYWDLKDKYNPHYFLLGDSDKIIGEMRESIIKSPYEKDDADLNELIYDLSDLEIMRYEGRRDGQFLGYKKLLKGLYKE